MDGHFFELLKVDDVTNGQLKTYENNGLVPPLGTIFTNKNNDLIQRHTRLSCVFQKHTKHTLFAVLMTILTAESRC